MIIELTIQLTFKGQLYNAAGLQMYNTELQAFRAKVYKNYPSEYYIVYSKNLMVFLKKF